MRDVASPCAPVQSLAPAARSADANGTGVDLQNYDGALVVVDMGAEGIATLSGTDKIAVELEESDDNSTYTDVAEADIVNPVSGTTTGELAIFDANAEAPAVSVHSYVGKKRYIRAVVNYSGTHGAATPNAVSIIRMLPRNAS